MKPYRIDSDLWFVKRQQWIEREQARFHCTEKAVLERWQSSRAIRRAVGWCLLGVLFTFILLAW
jgi:hypothetical protein